jgi:hypothetical protein
MMANNEYLPNPSVLQNLVSKSKASTLKFFNKLKKNKPTKLDTVVANIHEEVIQQTDCLACANCCKTTSPIFYNSDIDRIASKLKTTSKKFIDQYLHIDEDGDYVLNQAPCVFLDEQNYCSIYAFRPQACREYPHTDRKRFYQILDLTFQNTLICPAAYVIVEKLKQHFDNH